MKLPRASLVGLALPILSGCGLSLSPGAASSWGYEPKPTLTAGVAMVPERKSTTVLAAKVITRIDDGLSIRSGMLSGTYAWVALPGYLTWEPVLVALGVGQPASRHYDGPGAYGGAGTALYVRPFDNPARHKEFSIMHMPIEIVLGGRGGWWSSPERHRPTSVDFEYGAELGLRLVLGSDFASREQGVPNRDREEQGDAVPATSQPGAAR